MADSGLACCGIDCTGCGIKEAASDPAKAKQEAEAWRQRGHKDASPDWFRCQGCHGPDELVWSGNCRIRECCLKERQLANCSLCDAFPCSHILAFEDDGHAHHRAAVQRLRAIRGQA